MHLEGGDCSGGWLFETHGGCAAVRVAWQGLGQRLGVALVPRTVGPAYAVLQCNTVAFSHGKETVRFVGRGMGLIDFSATFSARVGDGDGGNA